MSFTLFLKGPQVQILMEDESPPAPDELQFDELNIIFRISFSSAFLVLVSEDVSFTD